MLWSAPIIAEISISDNRIFSISHRKNYVRPLPTCA